MRDDEKTRDEYEQLMRPCPFCGGAPRLRVVRPRHTVGYLPDATHRLGCVMGMLSYSGRAHYETMSAAVSVWNGEVAFDGPVDEDMVRQ